MSTSRRATGLDTEGVAIFAEKRSIFDGQSGLPGVELSQYNAPHYHVSPQLRQKKNPRANVDEASSLAINSLTN